MSVEQDISFVASLLPHYEVKESKKKGSIHCVSYIGFDEDNLVIGEGEKKLWRSFKIKIITHFGERFQEIFHNTCHCHKDFTIYLK